MLNIKSSIVNELSSIQIDLTNAGKAKDNTAVYLLNAGMRFPIIRVSKTVLQAGDIQAFSLKMGLRNQLPIATLAFADASSQFRQTDFIDKSTEVRMWLGYANSDVPPVNLSMLPIDVQVKNGGVIMKLALALPTANITVEHDTVKAMLSSFADKTGIGIYCNSERLLSATCIRNYVDMQPWQFVQQFMQDLHCQHWFINAQYQLCIVDIEQSIAEHVDNQCNDVFYSTDSLQKPMPIRYTNHIDTASQFKFAQFGYDFIDVDNSIPNEEAVVFDKAFTPDIAKLQTIEDDFVDFAIPIDTDCLYFEAPFDPYKQVGNTFAIDVYTTRGIAKRVTQQAYESGKELSMDQMLIEDVSGVYMLTDATYMFNGGVFNAWTAFQRPTIK